MKYSCQIRFYGHNLYVHLVPRDGLQYCKLEPLNVQDKQVDRWVANSQQDRVDWKALDLEYINQNILIDISGCTTTNCGDLNGVYPNNT